MAVVGNPHRLMMAFQGTGHSHAILAAAHSPYHYNSVYQDAQPQHPDRPIGYGAFGVVW